MPQCILIHGGPWAKARLTQIARGYDAEARIVYAFDWPEVDESGLGLAFRANLKSAQVSSDKIVTDPDAVVARCRYLRSLPKGIATHRIEAMKRAWDMVLDQEGVDVVISELVDSYVPHLLEKAAAERGLPFHGMVTCFVNGYCRTTRYGELVTYREPSDDEVENVTKALTSQSYRPAFVTSTISQSQKSRRAWLKSLGRMVIMGLRSLKAENRLRNHVYGAWATAKENAHLWPQIDLGEKDWQQSLQNQSKPWIFVPLQHSPESTIDYWCDDLAVIAYDKVLLETLSALSDTFNIIVKEHPNVLGFRSPRLYKELSRVPDLVFAPTDAPSSAVMAAADATLVWTGSVGFEAALIGKPVLTPTWPYYASGDRFMRISDQTDNSEIKEFVEKTAQTAITVEEQSDLVRNLLRGSVPGTIRFASNQPRNDDIDAADRAIGSELVKVDTAR